MTPPHLVQKDEEAKGTLVTETMMTRHEREDLQRLVRQREKVQKSAAKQRSAELLADFEAQMAAQYSFDDDAVWAEAAKAAKAEVDKAKAVVAQRCQELGIPKEFAPTLAIGWNHNGYRNGTKEQKAELRKVAVTKVAAMEARALVMIEQASVEAQTRLAIAGLSSEAAVGFIEALPSVDTLMSRLSFDEVAGKAKSPPASQLIAAPFTVAQASALYLAGRDVEGEVDEMDDAE